MDWFSWLSKTGLEACLVYEYGLAFSHNELEEDDIPYFNHEFLQSMGISIAKHRLEILKLARKNKLGPRPTMSRLLFAIKRSKRSLAKCLRNWIHPQESSSALVVVPRSTTGSRWRGAMLKRNKKLMMANTHHYSYNNKQPRLLLTNSRSISGPIRIESFSSPVVCDYNQKDHEETMEGDDDDDGYWSTGVEEIRWDTMFQDLKPT
ncbi:hypothetical protein LWI29_015294 [Acer saccharum]|uniref:SAM domain-containing protein n=1 Tax=Acer saccharum TaxID=4024 RepID=A0AA39SSK1_ACESA|nr:hypothetical protein LWI29_015294 [Acer saccharum]KAK1576882.1 hypothetical protein Q3G72_017189 [Acer saccharum]